MTNIYIDIDGVLLTKNHTASNHAHEFIKYVIANFPDTTYWLTTRCQGDASKPVREIQHLFDADIVHLLKRIKPTMWLQSSLKTDAIDFDVPFLWFDDYVFEGDKHVLREKGLIDNWIEVDLYRDPDQLLSFVASFPIPVNS